VCSFLAHFCGQQTHSFSMYAISQYFVPCVHHNLTPSPVQPEQLLRVHAPLQQKFTYIKHGLQCFVFVSEDQQYVLKIFRTRPQHKIWKYTWLSRLGLMTHHAERTIAKSLQQLKDEWASYQLVAQQLSEETALVFAHLGLTTNLPNPLRIIDPLGIEHCIDPNDYGFVLQRKMPVFMATLRTAIEHHEMQRAKELLHAFVLFLRNGIDQRLVNTDPCLRNNFGIWQGQVVHLDLGSLAYRSHEECIARACALGRELLNAMERFDPSLVLFTTYLLQEYIPKEGQ